MLHKIHKAVLFSLSSSWLLLCQEALGDVQTFNFGTKTPQIVCGILNLCDITLENGEKLQGIEIGDSVRWQIDSIFSGQGANKTPHIIVKPSAESLSTTLLIATDRRLYHINLKSSRDENMTSVKFKYPYSSDSTNFSTYSSGTDSSSSDGLSIDCNYTMTGDEEIMPKQVYSDGRKTYIKMPHEVRVRRMPGLVISRSNGLFSDDFSANVNYRIKGTTFEVDCVIDEARLILGNGSNRMEVLLRHGR